MDDGLDQTTAYAQAVAVGETTAGPLVRLACARHLRDIEEQDARGIRWDCDEAERVISFFSTVLRLNGGEHEGKPFVLQPWQAFIVGSLFGWKAADGYRRFRVAFIEVAKGNGKTPLLAGIGLYLLTADKEARAEIYSAAVDRDQASILFRDAVTMVDQSPALSSRLTKSGAAGREWNLAHLQSGSFFRPIATENTGRGKSGPRPHGALLDEVHEHASNAMVEFMRAGTKGRTQALILMITNSGANSKSVCWEYHSLTERMLKDAVIQEHFFGYVAALDEGDDPLVDETCWPKANPNLGVSISRKYLREQVDEAREMPSKQGIVLRLNFCVWTGAGNLLIPHHLWLAGAERVPDEELEGCPSWWGLDLSRSRDLTALVGVFELPDGRVAIRARFWLPEDDLDQREIEDRVPYRQWAQEGWLETTPGPIVRARMVAEGVAEELGRPGVVGLAFDRHRMVELLEELDELGVRYGRTVLRPGEPIEMPLEDGAVLVDWGQGHISMAPAIDELERVMFAKLWRHGMHPLMTMCAGNANVKGDSTENRRFVKLTEQSRDDGIVALAMALGLRKRLAPESVAPGAFWLTPA